MSTGAGQMMVDAAFVTFTVAVAVAPVKFTASLGVKVTESVCDPAVSTAPAAGEYVNVPGTLAVALSCVPSIAAPYTMATGAGQVMVDAALVTLTVAVAV